MTKKIIRNLVFFFIIFLFRSNSLLLSQEYNNSIHFAILGDRTGGYVPGIYGEIVNEIEMLKPDFVITVGDMIEGYTEDTDSIYLQWEEYMDIIEPLSAPIYFTPGNHDIWDDNSRRIYNGIIGKPYYSFDYQNLHFIILDNTCWYGSEELPEDEIDWLTDDLKKNQDAAKIFVFYHRPYWFETTADGEPDILHALFVNYGVDAVFTGHYHTYFTGEYDGILYTGVGSSGAGSHPGPAGPMYHYMWVTVDKDSIYIALIAKDAVYPWDEVTADDLKYIEKIEIETAIFEIPLIFNENLQSSQEIVNIRIHNISDIFEIKDTMKWNVQEGWNIEPEEIEMDLSPGEEEIYTFTIENIGTIYPLPSISFDFQYRENRFFSFEKELDIQRTANCYRITEPIQIDGQLDEIDWQNPVKKLFTKKGELITDSTEFYFLYDEKNLYAGVICYESDISSIIEKVQQRDGAVYYEDCVGFFFQPVFEDLIVYQLYINPQGVLYDAKIIYDISGEYDYDNSWDGDYEVRTFKSDNYWSVEVKIPVDQFEINEIEEDSWGLNFRRKRPLINGSYNWQLPINYDPRTYGRLIMK